LALFAGRRAAVCPPARRGLPAFPANFGELLRAGSGGEGSGGEGFGEDDSGGEGSGGVISVIAVSAVVFIPA
jgi:hypothetical protein